MPLGLFKETGLGILGCCVAILVSVWTVHGVDHALKPSVLLVMGIAGVLAGLSTLVLPGIKRGVLSSTDVEAAFTPIRVIFYILAFMAFGAFIVAVGWL